MYCDEELPYRAYTAQTLAETRVRNLRPPCKLRDFWLRQFVRTHLHHECSPEQIAG
ncbi:MAG: hypothetical protein R3B95_09425 [Nitrospirales bacterium]|nr:hypothetical protein [Nitrospirales bacterium]